MYYLSSGRGRKSGGARATEATPNLTPLNIIIGAKLAGAGGADAPIVFLVS